MPWDMNDYPNSMKNLDKLTRKKAIDIANALLADGYPDDRAIPIAISQAEKWIKDATTKEKAALEKQTIHKNDPHTPNKNAKKLMNADVSVKYQDKQWIVISDKAERASDTFQTKTEAIERAKKIAANKGSTLKIYKRDGDLQKQTKLKL